MAVEGRGIHAISREVRQAIGSKVGKNARDNKTGIHSMTDEERRQSGKLGAQANGANPWTDEEELFVQRLIEKPEFQRKSRIHAKRISAEVNRVFHEGKEVRKPRAVVKLVST
jgi:hypothetical protein